MHRLARELSAWVIYKEDNCFMTRFSLFTARLKGAEKLCVGLSCIARRPTALLVLLEQAGFYLHLASDNGANVSE